LQVSAGVRSKLDRAGVRIVTEKAAGWDFGGDRVDVRLEGGQRRFAAVYSGLGSDPQNTLARTLGAKLAADGRILTDAHQETSAEGVFAAGDVVTGLNQIAVAMAQGEIAATRIHSRLRLAEGRCVADSLSARSRRGWAGALVRPAPGGQTLSLSGTLPVQRGWDRPYRSSMPCMIRPLIS
ncbi:FAD-dependent oxidoreductase, partial [Paracoccus yeei]|uniref:FAD-dependent oxidoreductase n=1 Tax=Paracoccus yeei TaxID=147645 RepID=UPI0037D154FE